jgi:hypothetical protein
MVLEVDLCQRDRPTAIGPLTSADVAVSTECLPSHDLFLSSSGLDCKGIPMKKIEKKNLETARNLWKESKEKHLTEKEPKEKESF